MPTFLDTVCLEAENIEDGSAGLAVAKQCGSDRAARETVSRVWKLNQLITLYMGQMFDCILQSKFLPEGKEQDDALEGARIAGERSAAVKSFLEVFLMGEGSGVEFLQQTLFLYELRTELENMGMDAIIDPPMKFDESADHFVGHASVDLQKLFSVAVQYERLSEEAKTEARYARNPEERNAHVRRAGVLHAKSEATRTAFWISLKDEFSDYDLWHKFSIGVRDGWRVVWSDAKPSGIPPIIGLLGGNPLG